MLVDPSGMADLGIGTAIALGLVVGAACTALKATGMDYDAIEALMLAWTNIYPDVDGYISFLIDSVVNPLQSYLKQSLKFKWSDLPEEERAAFWGAVAAGVGIIIGGPVAFPAILLLMAGGAATGYYSSLIEQFFEVIFDMILS